MTARDPMDDAAYYSHYKADDHYQRVVRHQTRLQRDGLKVMVRQLSGQCNDISNKHISATRRAEAAEALVRELRAALDTLVREFNNHVENVRSDPDGADYFVPHLEALEARDAAVKVLAKSEPGEKNG